jgi:hypothetical protein
MSDARLVKAASMGRMCLHSKGLASANNRLADDNKPFAESAPIVSHQRPARIRACPRRGALAPAAALWYGLTTHIRARGCTLYLGK